jgi:hypothetical protein
MAFQFTAIDWDNGLEVIDDGIVGQSQITDGSGNTDYRDTTLIYNENFGSALDTTNEWTETINGTSTKATSAGILTLTGGALVNNAITEKNNGFSVNVSGKTKKIRLKVNMNYTGTLYAQDYFGFQSGSNFAVYFLKTAAGSWAGYIMDESTNEYQTSNFAVSSSTYHEWEIIFNSNRAEFFIDGVRKGYLNGNISVASCNLLFNCGRSQTFGIDWVRVWETLLPQ